MTRDQITEILSIAWNVRPDTIDLAAYHIGGSGIVYTAINGEHRMPLRTDASGYHLAAPLLHYHRCAWPDCDALTTGALCEAHAVQAAEMDSDSHDALDMAYAASRGMA